VRDDQQIHDIATNQNHHPLWDAGAERDTGGISGSNTWLALYKFMTETNSTSIPSDAAQRIIASAQSATSEDGISWSQVETDAQGLANVLRSRDESGNYSILVQRISH
jgi:hypothetical protein